MLIARVFVLLWFLLAFTLSVTGWFERFSSATLFGIGALSTLPIGYRLYSKRKLIEP